MSDQSDRPAARRRRVLLTGLAVSFIAFAAFAPAQDAPTPNQLRQIVREDPGNAHAWTDLGDALLAVSELEEAKAAYLEAIALDYRLGDAHFGLGLAEYNRGDFQAALFSFSEVARQHPERFDGHFNRGVTLARLRMHAEAAESFRMAIEQARPEATLDDEFNANLGLAGQLKLLGDFDGAAEAYEAASLIFPDDQDVRYLHAEALHGAGRGLDALPLLTELDAESSDYRISSLIADIYVEQGQNDYALRSLQRAIRNSEQTGSATIQASLFVKLGLLQLQLNQVQEALSSFERGTVVDPVSWEAHYNYGVTLLEQGRTETAVGPLETAVVLAPSSGEAKLALATAYERAGRSGEAIGMAAGALEILEQPELITQAEFVLGRAEYRTGEFETAAFRLAGVVADRPGDPQAQLWAGLAAYQLGDYDEAALYYGRVVQLSPSSREGLVNLAAAYLAGGRYQDAEMIYSELLQADPEDAASRYNLGWALLSQNRLTAARDAFEEASRLGYGPASEALTEYF